MATVISEAELSLVAGHQSAFLSGNRVSNLSFVSGDFANKIYREV